MKTLDLYNLYIPISLFTGDNLVVILREAASLETIKANYTTGCTSTKIQVLNVASFEKTYGKESGLSYATWCSAWRNYLRFCDEQDDTREKMWFKRWKDHYDWFQTRERIEQNFEAIKRVDITLRKNYISKPFIFNPATYFVELNTTIADVHQERNDAALLESK